MKIEDIDVDSAINSVKALLGKEKDLSPALRSALEVFADPGDPGDPSAQPPHPQQQQQQSTAIDGSEPQAVEQERKKRPKVRDLLERLRDFEADILRFMQVRRVPFTNNQGENDLRMTKVQQKIAGCFRSMQGTKIFCRVRSYLSTCRKQGMTATQALTLLFQGKKPDFMHIDNSQHD